MMEITTTVSGKIGEYYAAKYLVSKGFSIVETNYRFEHREIDIIAEDDEYLLFVEVKARTNNERNMRRYGRPGNAVTYKKQNLLMSAARHYLRTHEVRKKKRFDIIEVYFEDNPNRQEPVVEKITHLPNAVHSH